ncbi:MAG: patatin-like phospholipase family protein [Steroidobacteraceae bacterium]
MPQGTDTIIQNAAEQRNLPALFAALPLLKDIEPDYLRDIAAEIEWFSLPGGATLYSAGQPADGLYVIINGAIATYVARPEGGSVRTGSILPGETVGERELISGKPRASTAIALRDTELARLPGPTFERLVARHPRSMRQIATVLIQRLETLESPDYARTALPQTFAVVPHDRQANGLEFAEQLVNCLSQVGRTELVPSSRANDQTTHWFHRLERANRYVVYVTDPGPTNWSKLCLRQAQGSLVVVGSDSGVRPCTALRYISHQSVAVQNAELVLLHRGSRTDSSARPWLSLYPDRRHHHVRGPADVERVARLITGRALGLVLSGGGARGFAHIGVLRALRDAKMPVDAIGGTSIGAIIAAGCAAGWDCEEMIMRMRRSFVDTNPLNDYTLPLVSLVAGRKVRSLLQREFGDIDIENLRLPYYCMSANLTTNQSAVHRRGKLWFWLAASVAIPGVLPPIFTERQIHVDGATINNLPVDVMRDQLRGSVIAVDVGANRTFETGAEMTEVPALWKIPMWLYKKRLKINIMQILWRSGMINSTATTVGQRELTDLLLRPPLENIDMLDWQAFDRAIEVGYQYAVHALEQHRDRLIPVGALPTKTT